MWLTVFGCLCLVPAYVATYRAHRAYRAARSELWATELRLAMLRGESEALLREYARRLLDEHLHVQHARDADARWRAAN